MGVPDILRLTSTETKSIRAQIQAPSGGYVELRPPFYGTDVILLSSDAARLPIGFRIRVFCITFVPRDLRSLMFVSTRFARLPNVRPIDATRNQSLLWASPHHFGDETYRATEITGPPGCAY